jgi:hypothetical protein
MVLDAAGLSSHSRTRVWTAEDRTREAWRPLARRVSFPTHSLVCLICLLILEQAS